MKKLINHFTEAKLDKVNQFSELKADDMLMIRGGGKIDDHGVTLI